MKLTIVRPDKLIGVDDVFVTLDLDFLPDDIRVVQWDGEKGHVEKYDFSNEVITDISDFKPLIEAHARQLKLNENKQAEVINVTNGYNEITSKINDGFVTISKELIKPILKQSWTGLTLSGKIHDYELIGIYIDYLKGGTRADGIAGMLSLRTLVKQAKNSKVPLFADLMPDGIDKEQFSVFFEKLGAKVIRHSYANYMYMENKNG
jgi:hypothetical protein